MTDLPDPLPIAPRGRIDARVRVPGSKSITNRALVAAALAAGDSELRQPLDSDDTAVMRRCLEALGCAVEGGPDGWRVRGSAGKLRRPAQPLFAGNSGTTARFLTAAAALADGPVEIDGSPRMRERPIGDLTRALASLGVRTEVLGAADCPPVRVHGGQLPGGFAEVDASRSSQYVSALLLVAPYARRPVELAFRSGVLVSRPYVELTLRVMRSFGARADWTGPAGLRVDTHGYRGRAFAIEPDASAAVYPLCAAALTGGRVRVEDIPGDSVQADLALLPLLERMGCRVERGASHVEVRGPRTPLRGLGDVDLNELPDAVLALAVVAAFARGETRIHNVANLRIKETDRLAALETELRRIGATARAAPDSIEISGDAGALHGADVETYDDHRMAMSFALAGLRLPGLRVRDPRCVAKTWPGYFAMLERL